ncbi:MAG TPA: pimeloyl-ACP methyl ester esterase BioH, partial [Stenotrophomonas sp.]
HSRDDATPLRLPYLVNAIASATPAAVWCGWSLGGLVALHGAATLPQVRGLAMLAATPRFVRDADWPNAVEPVVFEQFGRDLEQDYRGTLERFLALDVMGSQHARSELRTLRDALVERGEPAQRALHEGLALLEHSDLRGGLPGLHKPGLWIGGQRDRLVPSKAMHQAAALAPAGLHSAHTIEGGGHAPFLGHADHVAGLLQQFVAGCT